MRLIWGRWNLEDRKVREDWAQRPSSAVLDFAGRGRHDEYQFELSQPAGWTMKRLYNWASEEILHYRVFPTSRMRAFVDSPNSKVSRGVTVFQGIYIWPFRIRMADRILDVFEGEDEDQKWSGFTYGTIQGHAELGIETFRITWDKKTSKVLYSMEAWSEPGHWLIRLLEPWARAVQKKAGREAMNFMESKLKDLSEGKP